MGEGRGEGHRIPGRGKLKAPVLKMPLEREFRDSGGTRQEVGLEL